MTYAVEAGIPLPPRYAHHEEPCSYCGVTGRHYAKGLCRKCWNRQRYSGSPEFIRPPGETLADKLRRRYRIEDECWIWHGRIIGGQPYHGGHPARRVAYELRCGEQPKGKRFSPTCSNPLCINPKHTEICVPPADTNEIIRSTERMPKREAAKVMREAGLKFQQIGDALGISLERARQLANNINPPKGKNKEVDARVEAITAMMRRGLMKTEMAVVLGIPTYIVGATIRDRLPEQTNGELFMEYSDALNIRRDELKARIGEIQPTIDELKRVEAAIRVLGGTHGPARIRRGGPTHWTKERLEELKRRIGEGMTFREIADDMGVTKKAIEITVWRFRLKDNV